MDDSVVLTELDHHLIQALQLDGRAPFRRIADALDVSENTIARRYRRLRGVGLRIVARTVPERVGSSSWLLRIQSTPDATAQLAQAIANYPQVDYVSVDAAGTQIHCGITTLDGDDDEPAILASLSRTSRVMAINAHCLLRTYAGDPPDWYTKLNPLSPTQHATLVLDQQIPQLDDEAVKLDDVDRAVLACLAEDPRASLPQVAAAALVSTPTAKRRLDQLRADGVLQLCTDFPARLIGYRLTSYFWLRVEPARLEEVGRALAGHPPISFAAATTGPFNLVAAATTRGTNDLYRYLTEGVGCLPGIQAIETAPAVRQVKRLV